jgi:hypothetical protein
MGAMTQGFSLCEFITRRIQTLQAEARAHVGHRHAQPLRLTFRTSPKINGNLS